MGKPTAGNAAVRRAEFIGAREQTEGSETSQYLEEKKEIFDSASSGERTRNRPNRRRQLRRGCGTAFRTSLL